MSTLEKLGWRKCNKTTKREGKDEDPPRLIVSRKRVEKDESL